MNLEKEGKRMIDLEKRAKAWDGFSGEAREFTIGDTFNSAYELGVRDGAASVDRRAIVEEAFEKGRASVVFNPHSHYRDKLREMICEGDFDFTNIFEEIEYEGETYADISNEGADALADYFIDLMEQIDERRSEDVVTVNICDTCEEPYQVNANFDRHDCGKAGAASVDRRAIVDRWQSMESAPKTGEHIQVINVDGHGFGFCGGKRQHASDIVHWFVDGFYSSIFGTDQETPMTFTHWRPLPDKDAILAEMGGEE